MGIPSSAESGWRPATSPHTTTSTPHPGRTGSPWFSSRQDTTYCNFLSINLTYKTKPGCISQATRGTALKIWVILWIYQFNKATIWDPMPLGKTHTIIHIFWRLFRSFWCCKRYIALSQWDTHPLIHIYIRHCYLWSIWSTCIHSKLSTLGKGKGEQLHGCVNLYKQHYVIAETKRMKRIKCSSVHSGFNHGVSSLTLNSSNVYYQGYATPNSHKIRYDAKLPNKCK